MSVRIVKVDKEKPPSEWEVVDFAYIDATEPFMAQLIEIAGDLLDATTSWTTVRTSNTRS